jgi:hypothetical protein
LIELFSLTKAKQLYAANETHIKACYPILNRSEKPCLDLCEMDESMQLIALKANILTFLHILQQFEGKSSPATAVGQLG